jgi:hypothetical protein
MLPFLSRLLQLFGVLKLFDEFGVRFDKFELEIVSLAFRGVWNVGVVVALMVAMFEIGHNEYYKVKLNSPNTSNIKIIAFNLKKRCLKFA